MQRYPKNTIALGKILFIVALLVVLVLAIEEITDENQFRIEGEIEQQTFLDLVEFYERNEEASDRVVVNTRGGSAFAALAIGRYILKNNLDVEVDRFCGSSCANYVFLAGKNKYLKQSSLIVFHGGALQKNLLNKIKKAVRRDTERHYSGVDAYWSDESYDERLCQELGVKLGFCEKAEDCYEAFIKLEKAFFDKINVDQKITIYGQIGEYKPLYKSKEYLGFYYSLEELKKMGVSGIKVTGLFGRTHKWSMWAPFENMFWDVADKFYQVEIN